MRRDEFFLGGTGYFYRNNGNNKLILNGAGMWVIIGRFGNKFALAYPQWGTIGVDLNDVLSTNKISDVLCCDGPFRLHLTNKNTRALFRRSQKASFLTKIRREISKTYNATCANTDTRLCNNEFFKENPNLQIPNSELGWAMLLSDFLYIWKWYRGAPWRATFRNYRE